MCATASTRRRWPNCSPGPSRSSTSGCEGSAIRRIGHERWLRNIAVGLGNAASSGLAGDAGIVAALTARAGHPSALVREHVAWALARHAA